MCAGPGLRVTQTGTLRYSAMTLLPASSMHSKPFLNAVSDILRFSKRIRGSSVLLHSTGLGIHRVMHPGHAFPPPSPGEARPGCSRLPVLFVQASRGRPSQRPGLARPTSPVQGWISTWRVKCPNPCTWALHPVAHSQCSVSFPARYCTQAQEQGAPPSATWKRSAPERSSSGFILRVHPQRSSATDRSHPHTASVQEATLR